MKKLVAKVGEYKDKQTGETKGRYANLGVLMQGNDGGEYILMDPLASVSGAFSMQQAMNAANGKAPSDRLMVSVWEENSQQQGQGAPQQQQQGYQQNTQQPQQQQGGYQQQQSSNFQNGQGYTQQNG